MEVEFAHSDVLRSMLTHYEQFSSEHPSASRYLWLFCMCCPYSTFFCFQFKLSRAVKHHFAILHCSPDLKQEYTTEKKQKSSSFQTNGELAGDGLVKFLLSESENKLKNN